MFQLLNATLLIKNNKKMYLIVVESIQIMPHLSGEKLKWLKQFVLIQSRYLKSTVMKTNNQ